MVQINDITKFNIILSSLSIQIIPYISVAQVILSIKKLFLELLFAVLTTIIHCTIERNVDASLYDIKIQYSFARRTTITQICLSL